MNRVIYMDLPTTVKGFCVRERSEDFYTIVLNSKMSHVCNIETCIHELEHISKDDFRSFLSASEIEKRASEEAQISNN